MYINSPATKSAAYRPVRIEETLEVRCWQCFTNQELSARSERFQCRICGSRLRIEWSPSSTLKSL